MNPLRLDVYNALEVSSYLTVQELALQLDSGAPASQARATQAQVRDVLRAEPEIFWPDEERWDLALFHHFADQPRLFRRTIKGGQVFDQDRFIKTVLTEACRLKGAPIEFKTLAEKYLLKIARSLGAHRDEFPTGSGQAQKLLREFLAESTSFHILKQNGDRWVWNKPDWPEPEPVQPVAVAIPVYLLPPDFLDRAYEYLNGQRGQPVRLLAILQNVLGIHANHRDFSSAYAQANAALSADAETFAQIQEQAWALTAHLPAEIEEIPARVAIPRWRNPQEERLIQDVDALPQEALAPVAEFVEEEADATQAQFDESYFGPLRFALPYHWRQAGVLKVNARERRLFPDRPARVCLQFTDQTGQTFSAWLNNDTGYLYGLKDWYAAYLVPAGGVFYIQRATGSKHNFTIRIKEAQAHTFDGKRYVCEVDEDTYIEEDRLRDLERLRAQVQAAQATIKDVICDLFEHCPPDTCLHYKQLWSQAHVIRPTTRRTVAAILSLFPCFHQVDPGSGSWLYVPALRDAPAKSYARPAPKRTTKVTKTTKAKPAGPPAPTPVAPVRPQRHWLVPVRAASWDTLARPAGAGDGVYLVPWRGRSRVVKGDQLVFYDAEAERMLAAAQVLRPPVREADRPLIEVAVKPLLDAFTPLPYTDIAGAISVPRPEPDGFPIEITQEDLGLLLKRLTPITAKPAAPTLEEMIEQALPKPAPEQPAGEIIPHTYGPNPTIPTFIARYGRPYDPNERYERAAFAQPVKAGKNTAIYNAHSYHTKVPPQGIEPYIEHYTRPGDMVLDPFCGSGMTGVAALKLGRRVILNDLSPAATHIAYNYCTPVDVDALRREFERIKAAVKDEFDWLYGTTCERCGGPAMIQYTVWSDVFQCQNCDSDMVLWEVAVDHDDYQVREWFTCPACGKEQTKVGLKRRPSVPVLTNYACPQCKPHRFEHPTTVFEKERIAEVEAKDIPYWIPSTEFDPRGPQYRRNALSSRKIRRVTDLYTKRNLWAYSRLWHEAKQVPDRRLLSVLQFALTAINNYINKKQSYGGGGGGLSGSIYVPSFVQEKHVGLVFERKVDNLIKNPQALSEAVCIITTGSATKLNDIGDHCIDYVFTDPPFGSSLYYSEVNLLWEAWLEHCTDATSEAVVHRKQDGGTKRLPDYARLMAEAFHEMYRVLKPGRWASIVFHNSDDQVWRTIQQAAEDAGFDLVNAMVFDKEQRSFKGIRGEKGLENVTNFDIVLNLHKKSEVTPAAQPEAQDRVERLLVAAVDEHLRAGPAPDYRTGQYLHSLALRTLLNEKVSIELTWEQLERILNQSFRHVNCHWYLPKETVTTSGHGFLVRSESAAVAWLEHVLAANPQKESDLTPQWQIATLGAGSQVKRTLPQLLEENLWPDEATGLWCVPTPAQKEMLKKRRVRPEQLALGLAVGDVGGNR